MVITSDEIDAINQAAEQPNSVDPLFIEPQKGTAILIIDRSASTKSKYYDKIRSKWITIFERMAEICAELGHAEYRVIFWNSPTCNANHFRNGVMKLPFVVKNAALKAVFITAAECPGLGTCPYIGFAAIEPEWLKSDPMVYFLTDGQIGCNEISLNENIKLLAAEIRKLPTQLTIIAVELVQRDFNKIENVNNSAGGDIYKLANTEHLTGKISKFISYGPTDSFVQINKARAPAGFAPYGDKYFSVMRVPEFMEYVFRELNDAPADDVETVELSVAQKLASTLGVLTKDKPRSLINDIIHSFARMFRTDTNMINYIIADAIEHEHAGQARVFANYRAGLKDLFRQADILIRRNVGSATGMSGQFISHVINGRILCGPTRLAQATITISNATFASAGYASNIPVFPLLTIESAGKLSEIQDQCLRQWMRIVYSAIYSVAQTSDEIIYLILGVMLQVVQSPNVSLPIKEGYRQLARCILRKKRLNSIQTEMDYLLSGEPPIPNSGIFQDFINYILSVQSKLALEGTPMMIWYNMCSALDPELASRQKRHCQSELKDVGIKDVGIEDVGIEIDVIPPEASYDYNCIVMEKNISDQGGIAIHAHTNHSMAICSPVYVISMEGYHRMIQNNNCICPVCYKKLKYREFKYVGPYVPFQLPESYLRYAIINKAKPQIPIEKKHVFLRPGILNRIPRGNPVRKVPPPRMPNAITNANNRVGKLVVLHGVYGSGKSWYAKKIKNEVEQRGGVCLIEGPDKYIKLGGDYGGALTAITANLAKISSCNNNDLVVILDTHGTKISASVHNIFSTNFTGWTRFDIYPNLIRSELAGYISWTLYTLRTRKAPGPDDDYMLNPVEYDIQRVIRLHEKKFKAIFSTEYSSNTAIWRKTIDELKPVAEWYASRLVPFMMPVGL